LDGVQVGVPQQQLHPAGINSRADGVDGKRMPERVRVDVNVDHTTVFLDDVPDLHA